MMKLTHILASAAIISTLSACNGSLQTADRTPVDYVNPYIGNISHLLVPTFPTIQLPNSMLRVYPERADYTSELLKGLPLIVTNHRERSAFNFSPYQGEKLRPVITYNYDNEHITPYSFDVELDDNRMKAEYALSPGTKGDLRVRYVIDQGVYDINVRNYALDYFEQPMLGS